jgi:nucleoside-diphosphate-sugar epimerase
MQCRRAQALTHTYGRDYTDKAREQGMNTKAANVRTVLVTGATGTVGGAVVDALAASGRYQIHAVVRRPASERERIVLRKTDLSQPGFSNALNDIEYDFIIHCAQPRTDPELTSTGENFDLRVVRELERLCTSKTRRLLYTSGVWVYGHQPAGQRIRETSPMNPISRGADRLRTLNYLRVQSPCPWVEIVLPSLVYGNETILNLRGGLLSGAAKTVDDESILWSLIEQSDAGQAYLRLLEANDSERLFVLAEPDPLPVVQLYRMVADELGISFRGTPAKVLARSIPTPDLEAMTISQPVDSSLFRQRTGWRNRHVFRDRYKDLLKSQ